MKRVWYENPVLDKWDQVRQGTACSRHDPIRKRTEFQDQTVDSSWIDSHSFVRAHLRNL